MLTGLRQVRKMREAGCAQDNVSGRYYAMPRA